MKKFNSKVSTTSRKFFRHWFTLHLRHFPIFIRGQFGDLFKVAIKGA